MDERMRFGIAPPNWGAYGNPREAARLAEAAEQAGWDGYFTWDSLPVKENPPPTYDPWVILSSVAMATERIRIGTCVAVVPRYKPHLLAMRLASLDVLSSGRLIFGVGLGDWSAPAAFDAFGELADPRVRAEMLDEGLEIITKLWSGDAVNHRGSHYVVEGFALTATPIQQPRIPVWVGGSSAAALRRAARWDGWIGPDDDPLNAEPKDAAAIAKQLEGAGPLQRTFEIAWSGRTTAEDASRVDGYRQAGATWWIDILLGDAEDILKRVVEGPPR